MQRDPTTPEDVLGKEEASAWLVERRFLGVGPTHLIADEVRVPRFRVSRVWHTAAALDRAADPESLYAFVVADGAAEVSFGSTSRTVTAGGLVVAPVDESLGLRVADRFARFEFEVGASELGLSPDLGAEVSSGIVAEDAAPSFRPVLLATMNAAFNAQVTIDSTGFSAFRLAATSLVSGLLVDAVADRTTGRSSRDAVLHRRALDAIAVHCSDPAFGPRNLAHLLSISERHLRRVFAAGGGSPASALREARLLRARTLLSDPSSPAPAEAARRAGFRSTRALRRATAIHGRAV